MPSDAVALAPLPQCTGRNKETRGSALDSIYSITVRTARKADELTGGVPGGGIANACLVGVGSPACSVCSASAALGLAAAVPLPAFGPRPNRPISKLRTDRFSCPCCRLPSGQRV